MASISAKLMICTALLCEFCTLTNSAATSAFLPKLARQRERVLKTRLFYSVSRGRSLKYQGSRPSYVRAGYWNGKLASSSKTAMPMAC